MNSKFYDIVYRLEYIIRYSNVPRVHDESVASHTFFVCAILMDLRESYDFNLGDALQIAVAHDMPEAYTNDISHETKRLFPKIKEALEEAEEVALKKFPTSVQLGVRRYKSEDPSVEALFVHLADTIQCNQYAAHEVSLGNKGYMEEVVVKSSERADELFKQVERYRLDEH